MRLVCQIQTHAFSEEDGGQMDSSPQFCYFPSKNKEDGEADKPGTLLDIAIELHNEVHKKHCPGNS